MSLQLGQYQRSKLQRADRKNKVGRDSRPTNPIHTIQYSNCFLAIPNLRLVEYPRLEMLGYGDLGLLVLRHLFPLSRFSNLQDYKVRWSHQEPLLGWRLVVTNKVKIGVKVSLSFITRHFSKNTGALDERAPERIHASGTLGEDQSGLLIVSGTGKITLPMKSGNCCCT